MDVCVVQSSQWHEKQLRLMQICKTIALVQQAGHIFFINYVQGTELGVLLDSFTIQLDLL